MKPAKYTCQVCERPLYEGARSWYVTTWHHDAEMQDEGRCPETGRGAKPREVCTWRKGDGEECLRPVKHDDMLSGVYACGVHAPKFIEEREREERNRKREEERRQKEEIENWELGVYQAAYDKLTEIDPELFPEKERPSKGWRGFDRTVALDIVDLERWLRERSAAS